MMRIGRVSGLALLIAVITAVAAGGTDRSPDVQPKAVQPKDSGSKSNRNSSIEAASDPGGAGQTDRLREGTVFDAQMGGFQTKGDRIWFYPEDKELGLRVLENLALERIWTVLDEVRDRTWHVDGVVTEYRGHNYLLIDRAVIRSGTLGETARP